MTQSTRVVDPIRHESEVLETLGIVPEPDNLFHQVLQRTLAAGELAGVRAEYQLILAQPKNEITVHFPVRMDDGSWRVFAGYRVQHNDALGPYKGGLRFHPRTTLSDLRGLALHMTMKCALLRLPLGGACGGVAVDGRVLSRDEMMRVVRRYATAIGHQVGANYDIPGPERGADHQMMAWFADTIAQMTPDASRQGTRPIVTGKPPELGGMAMRDTAVGGGFVFVLREMLPELGLSMRGLRFSVAGYGRIGSQVARMMVTAGATMVAAADRRGGVANAEGIDPIDLGDHMQDEGTVCGWSGKPTLSEEEFYRQKVDVLILAAGERTIDGERAAMVQAPVVAEAANLPWTADSDDVFLRRGIEVLPSVLCNAGGVVGSYLEWMQNRSHVAHSPQDIDTRLEQALVLAARRMKLARVRYDCDWRTAAYAAAMEHLGRVYELRGIFP